MQDCMNIVFEAEDLRRFLPVAVQLHGGNSAFYKKLRILRSKNSAPGDSLYFQTGDGDADIWYRVESGYMAPSKKILPVSTAEANFAAVQKAQGLVDAFAPLLGVSYSLEQLQVVLQMLPKKKAPKKGQAPQENWLLLEVDRTVKLSAYFAERNGIPTDTTKDKEIAEGLMTITTTRVYQLSASAISADRKLLAELTTFDVRDGMVMVKRYYGAEPVRFKTGVARFVQNPEWQCKLTPSHVFSACERLSAFTSNDSTRRSFQGVALRPALKAPAEYPYAGQMGREPHLTELHEVYCYASNGHIFAREAIPLLGMLNNKELPVEGERFNLSAAFLSSTPLSVLRKLAKVYVPNAPNEVLHLRVHSEEGQPVVWMKLGAWELSSTYEGGSLWDRPYDTMSKLGTATPHLRYVLDADPAVSFLKLLRKTDKKTGVEAVVTLPEEGSARGSLCLRLRNNAQMEDVVRLHADFPIDVTHWDRDAAAIQRATERVSRYTPKQEKEAPAAETLAAALFQGKEHTFVFDSAYLLTLLETAAVFSADRKVLLSYVPYEGEDQAAPFVITAWPNAEGYTALGMPMHF